MAPNQRHPDKAYVSLYVPKRMKSDLLARAAAEGMTITDAVVQALEEWLGKPPGNDENAPTR